jgi:DNA-binding HxlR family transcriptional regulator
MVRSRRANPISDCPLTAALTAVGGKWKMIIVYSLAERPYHFAGVRQFLPNVSQKVLTEQLRELIGDDIVVREETGPLPAPVLYSLTEYGRTLLPLIDFAKAWGRAHIEHFTEEQTEPARSPRPSSPPRSLPRRPKRTARSDTVSA